MLHSHSRQVSLIWICVSKTICVSSPLPCLKGLTELKLIRKGWSADRSYSGHLAREISCTEISLWQPLANTTKIPLSEATCYSLLTAGEVQIICLEWTSISRSLKWNYFYPILWVRSNTSNLLCSILIPSTTVYTSCSRSLHLQGQWKSSASDYSMLWENLWLFYPLPC